MTLWTFEISLATLRPLEPTPHRESTKVRFFLGNRRKFLYIKIEISLLNFAAGLKNAGNFEGSLWLSEREGTRICVLPSFTILQDLAAKFCCRIIRKVYPYLYRIVNGAIAKENRSIFIYIYQQYLQSNHETDL